MIVIPDVEVLRESWTIPLARPAEARDFWAAVAAIHRAARDVGVVGTQAAREHIWDRYRALRAILCGDGRRLGPWPEGFWSSDTGRMVYYAFVVAYGDELLYPNDVALILGVSVQRVGHLHARLMLDYLVDADPAHPHRWSRRMTRAMIEDFLARRASPEAVARYRAYGEGSRMKEDRHVNPGRK